MKVREILFESDQPKRVAVIIGRFNPPTLGHYSLINKVQEFVSNHANLHLEPAPVVMIVAGSKSDADLQRNPLSGAEREHFMQSSGKLPSGTQIVIAKNPFEGFARLRESGLEPIAIGTGEESRMSDYMRILKGFKSESGSEIARYPIKLGRDAEAIEFSSKQEKEQKLTEILDRMRGGGHISTDEISGSLLRRAVQLGYEEEFLKLTGFDSNPSAGLKMFNLIKERL